MDRELGEELKSLGIFGIYKEAYKIIFSRRKLFTQITLSLILPLCFFFFVHSKLSSLISSESTFATFCVLKTSYFILILIFSIVLTSVITYTITCIYICQSKLLVNLNEMMKSIDPMAWKRVMITYLWTIFLLFSFTLLVAILVLYPLTLLMSSSGHIAKSTITIVLVVSYLLGFVYLTFLLQLASVVSVLEEVKGIEALKRTMTLTKGKKWVAFCIFGKLNFLALLLQFVLSLEIVDRVVYGAICLLALAMLSLFSHVIQTVLYFVCKSYHGENIKKLAFDQFDDHDHHKVIVYLREDVVPLKANKEYVVVKKEGLCDV